MVNANVDSMALLVAQRSNRWLDVSVRFARRRPLGAAGAAIVVLMGLMAALAELIFPFHPLATNYGAMLQAPGAAHWLGTDAFGRDVMTRIIYGSRTPLWGGFCSSLFGASV